MIYFRNDRLKAHRKALGLTQRELAERCGVARLTLNDWEIGRRAPLARPLTELARALNVRMEYLMNGSDQP